MCITVITHAIKWRGWIVDIKRRDFVKFTPPRFFEVVWFFSNEGIEMLADLVEELSEDDPIRQELLTIFQQGRW